MPSTKEMKRAMKGHSSRSRCAARLSPRANARAATAKRTTWWSGGGRESRESESRVRRAAARRETPRRLARVGGGMELKSMPSVISSKMGRKRGLRKMWAGMGRDDGAIGLRAATVKPTGA